KEAEAMREKAEAGRRELERMKRDLEGAKEQMHRQMQELRTGQEQIEHGKQALAQAMHSHEQGQGQHAAEAHARDGRLHIDIHGGTVHIVLGPGGGAPSIRITDGAQLTMPEGVRPRNVVPPIPSQKIEVKHEAEKKALESKDKKKAGEKAEKAKKRTSGDD